MSLPLSRRAALGGAAALSAAAPFALSTPPAAAAPLTTGRPSAESRAATKFVQRVVDAYRTSGFRLAQSYQDDSGLTDIAFTYDNALAIIALLAAGESPPAAMDTPLLALYGPLCATRRHASFAIGQLSGPLLASVSSHLSGGLQPALIIAASGLLLAGMLAWTSVSSPAERALCDAPTARR